MSERKTEDYVPEIPPRIDPQVRADMERRGWVFIPPSVRVDLAGIEELRYAGLARLKK